MQLCSFDCYIEMIERGLDLLHGVIPQDSLGLLLGRYEPSEIVEAFKTIQSFSTFEWCADKGAIKQVKKEVSKIVNNVKSSFLMGDIERLQMYFQDYFLKERALKAIRNAQTVLENINLL